MKFPFSAWIISDHSLSTQAPLQAPAKHSSCTWSLTRQNLFSPFTNFSVLGRATFTASFQCCLVGLIKTQATELSYVTLPGLKQAPQLLMGMLLSCKCARWLYFRVKMQISTSNQLIQAPYSGQKNRNERWQVSATQPSAPGLNTPARPGKATPQDTLSDLLLSPKSAVNTRGSI